jgi:hypothetical protein
LSSWGRACLLDCEINSDTRATEKWRECQVATIWNWRSRHIWSPVILWNILILWTYCLSVNCNEGIFFFFEVLGFELRASCLLGRHSTSPILWFFFEIRSWKLFSQAGFEPSSSWSSLLSS